MNYDALKKMAPVVLIPATVLALALYFLKVQFGILAIMIYIVGLVLVSILVYKYYDDKSKEAAWSQGGGEIIPPLNNTSESAAINPPSAEGLDIP